MPNRLQEIDFLKAKIDAGADYIVTQLFFDNRDFYDFRERCEFAGIHVPVIAGIMPITSHKGMLRMAELAAGARFPAPLLRALARVEGDDQQIEQLGIHWATEQIRDLIDHQMPGVHLYTLNKSHASLRIYQTLGIKNTLQYCVHSQKLCRKFNPDAPCPLEDVPPDQATTRHCYVGV